MKIELLTGLSGDGWVEIKGTVVERDDEEAERLIKAGLAKPVTRKVETAAKRGGELRK
jgi:hypothetical protein